MFMNCSVTWILVECWKLKVIRQVLTVAFFIIAWYRRRIMNFWYKAISSDDESIRLLDCRKPIVNMKAIKKSQSALNLLIRAYKLWQLQFLRLKKQTALFQVCRFN